MIVFSRNPIMRAELAHQQRAVLRRGGRMLRALFAFSLVASVGVAALSPLLPQIATALNEPFFYVLEAHRGVLSTLTALLAALLFVQHLLWVSQAAQQASATIAREKQARTWESLLLTGIDARQIIVGKWGATLRTLWEQHQRALLLRALAVVWLALPNTAGLSLTRGESSVGAVALAALVAALYPLMNVSVAAALGVLASLFGRRETTSYQVANLLQGALMIASVGLCFLPILFIRSQAWAQMLPLVFLAPLDGGLLTILGVVLADQELGEWPQLLGAIALSAGLYTGLTWALLRAAQSVAVRQHALPPATQQRG
jgi:ABC-type Na+ efflux pump permease subunit